MATAEECAFCDDTQEPESQFSISSPLTDEGDVFLKPALGMLMPGYLLAITREHLTSFAQLDKARLAAIDQRLNLYEKPLAERFGRYFRIESGSDNLKDCGSGGCIEHAHIHLMPADEDAGQYIQEQLPWEQLDRYEDLAEFRGHPYIYLGRLASHYVVPDPRLHSQWARRQVASVRGLEHWDWALDPGFDELRVTLEGLKDFPLKIFTEKRLENE